MADSKYEIVRLYDPSSVPVRGMRSKPSPRSLAPGLWSNLLNVRFDTQDFYVRQGMKQLATPPTAGATYRGSWTGTLQGSLLIVGAFSVSGATRLYSLNPSSFAWTELTNDGSVDAKQGNTRFPAGSASVAFAAVIDTDGKEILVATNGTDFPRVYDPSLPSLEQVVIHQPVTVPNPNGFAVQFGSHELGAPDVGLLGASEVSHVLAVTSVTAGSPTTITTTVAHGLNVGDYVIVFYSVTDPIDGVWQVLTVPGATSFTIGANTTGLTYTPANVLLSDQMMLTVQNGTPVLGVTPKATSSSSVYSALTRGSFGAVTLHPTGQVWVPLSGDTTLFDFVAIDVSNNGSTWTVLYDPTVSSSTYPAYVIDVDPNNPNTYVAAFNLQSSTTYPATRYIRFRCTASPQAISQTYYGFFSTAGKVQGGSQYSVSWINSTSRAESTGYVIPNPNGAMNAWLPNASAFLTAQIPLSDLLYFEPTVFATNVAAGQITNGVDSFNIYRMDPGEVDFSFVSQTKVNFFNSGTNSWITTNAGNAEQFVDTTLVTQKNIARVAPDAYSAPLPSGTCIASANNRVFVGGVLGGTGSRGFVWISEDGLPFRFRSVVRFLDAVNPDPSSATVDDFPGETVTGLARIGGYLIGVDPIAVFSDVSVYRLDGTDSASLSRPTRLGQHGCPFPGSIVEHYGLVYWVDPERQVRLWDRGFKLLSKNKIDDRLLSGNLTSCSAAIMLDRYYLAYGPGGSGTNTGELVYETILQEWCEDSFQGGINAAGLLTLNDGILRKIYAFSVDGHVYQVEAPGQSTDAGTAIPVTLTSRMLTGQGWNLVTARRCGISCDFLASTLWTAARTWIGLRNGTGNDGELNLGDTSDGGVSAYSWEAIPTSAIQPGGSGVGFQLTLTGNAPSGTRLFAIVQEVMESPDKAVASL